MWLNMKMIWCTHAYFCEDWHDPTPSYVPSHQVHLYTCTPLPVHLYTMYTSTPCTPLHHVHLYTNIEGIKMATHFLPCQGHVPVSKAGSWIEVLPGSMDHKVNRLVIGQLVGEPWRRRGLAGLLRLGSGHWTQERCGEQLAGQLNVSLLPRTQEALSKHLHVGKAKTSL